jgi:ATP-dependent Clp protease ATP-binding subunit ClpA
MNRIDKVVVFRSLKERELQQIVDLELNAVRSRVNESQGPLFTFTLTEEAKRFLLAEGIDERYGARHLKRAIERFLVYPLSNLIATGQVQMGDVIIVGIDAHYRKLSFELEPAVTAPQAA